MEHSIFLKISEIILVSKNKNRNRKYLISKTCQTSQTLSMNLSSKIHTKSDPLS